MHVDGGLIDCHTHIGHLPGAVGDVYTAEDLVYICEQENARFMLVSSASATTIGQHIGTREVAAMVAAHGDRLGGMLWVNPHDPTWADDVAVAVSHGFMGVKIHPLLDHYEVSRAALDGVFDCARAHGWPILTHTDVDGTSMAAARYEPLIRAYPDVPLILAHLRWGAIPLAKRYDNVFLDTTYMDAMTIEIGVDALGPDKILFGSDAAEGFEVGRPPGRERSRRSYAGLIGELRSRSIPESALDRMLSANACDLFHIRA
jgi:predicted TIM-barrel fold metal-dependent hydrolase